MKQLVSKKLTGQQMLNLFTDLSRVKFSADSTITVLPEPQESHNDPPLFVVTLTPKNELAYQYLIDRPFKVDDQGNGMGHMKVWVHFFEWLEY